MFYFNIHIFDFGDGTWRQSAAWNLLLIGSVEVNALAQGTLRQFTQWPWVDYLTFYFKRGRSATELSPPQEFL